MSSPTGNRITDNAFTADDGRALIARAILEIGKQYGWRPIDDNTLFSGVYYDSSQVGSFITRVTDEHGAHAVLKLQLRPLPFDEGMIIRHIQPQIKSHRIRLPKIIADEAFDETRGYGYLVMEDLSDLPHLWTGHCPTEPEMVRHEIFLDEFMHHVLPIAPYVPEPSGTLQGKYRESLDHFSAIANASAHRHIEQDEIKKMKQEYMRILERGLPDDFHFTHGHLSGMEIKEDHSTDSFILFANLLWSFRPKYYEMVFPLWVDLMGIRDTRVTSRDLLARVDRWADLWQNVQHEDPRASEFFWFLLLERSMMTVMLDLGASEWRADEQPQKQALLNAWTDVFRWLIVNKF